MTSPNPTSHSRPGSFWSLFDRPGGWAFMLFFIASIAGALYLQTLEIGKYHEKPWIETLTLPQPQYVERLALGYNAWGADFLYLRAIQAFGGIYYRPAGGVRQYDVVFNYFDVISALDPHFIEAYIFGNLVMGDEGGRQDLAMAYLEKGQWNNWRRYIPWYEAAYIKIWGTKEPDLQARYFVRQAVKCHDAPDWIGRWENYIDQQAGQFRLAILRWVQTYAEAVDSNQPYLISIALNRIRPTVDEWHRRILQDAADKFTEEKGRPPESLQEVADAGYLPPVKVVDPDILLQTLQELTQTGQSLAPLVESIVDQSIVEKGGVLPCYESTIANDRFVLGCVPGTDRREVWKESQRERACQVALIAYRQQLEDYYKEHGKYPEAVDGWPLASLGAPIPDPYCQGWAYDPKTGVLHSKGRPDL